MDSVKLSYRIIAVKAAYVLAIALMVAASVGLLQAVLSDTARASNRPGIDFAVFHGTALLVVEGDGAGMYEPEVLGSRMAAATGYSEISTQEYVRHPPFFSLFFTPFTALPFAAAYLAFLAGGASALAFGVSRVGLKRAWLVVGLALLSVPGLWTIQLGQMGLWVGALLIAVFLSLRSEHPFRAGLLLGLLAFKPTYALGIGIWWLIRAKRYPLAIAGAAVSVSACAALGLAIPGAWSAYLSLVDESGEGLFGAASVTSGFSILEMWAAIFANETLAVVLWLALVVPIVVGFAIVVRRLDDRLELSLGLAVVMGLLIAPRTGWYDWVLLVVPGVLLWQTYPRLRSQLVVAGAWLFSAGAISWLLATRLNDTTGLFFQLAPVVLAGVTLWWVRLLVADVAMNEPAPVA